MLGPAGGGPQLKLLAAVAASAWRLISGERMGGFWARVVRLRTAISAIAERTAFTRPPFLGSESLGSNDGCYCSAAWAVRKGCVGWQSSKEKPRQAGTCRGVGECRMR